jgi:hypothetical protein
MSDLFNQPLESFLDTVCDDRPDLKADRRKVGAVLKLYREDCGRRLRVSDVYLDSPADGEVLTRRFVKFVNDQPPPPGRKPARHARGIGEDKSRLRKLLRAYVPGDKEPEATVSLADMDSLPEQWEVLKGILPRAIPGSELARVKAGLRGREDFPYSFASQHFVSVLRAVSEEHKVTDLKTILNGLNGEVTRAMKRRAPHAHHRMLAVEFSRFRKAYFAAVKLPVPKLGKKLPLEKFPGPLRAQVEHCRRQMLLGFGLSEELSRVAVEYDLQQEPYRQSTVDGMVVVLETVLGRILAGKAAGASGLGIEDLIKTTPVQIKNKAGEITKVRFVNELVEGYYRAQRERVTPSKRAGFDMACFEHFRSAVALVAAANGYEDYIGDFRKGYPVRLDRATRKEKKSWKKKVFDRALVDEEITHLRGEVHWIVKAGTFKMDHVGKDDDVQKRLTKVLLFVNLVVLRYLGYRQQCLRLCKLGEHIIFNKDGSITLDFPKGIVKNKKHIRLTLNRRDHGSTHGIVLETLWLYYDHVYPYVLEHDRGVDGHFFVSPTGGMNVFRRYKTPHQFRDNFGKWVAAHIRYERFVGAQERNLVLHPHFFRGCCVDWLMEDLGWSRDEVAFFIADEPETLKEYVNANRIYDATKLLAKANRELKAEQALRDSQRLEVKWRARTDEHKRALKVKDQELQEAREEGRRAMTLLEREKDEKEELRAETRDLRAQIASLQSAFDQLRGRVATA